MTAEVLSFLKFDPGRIALFEAVESAVLSLGESGLAVAKTQISWGNPKRFAFLSLPRRAAQGRDSLILTFGLGRRAEHPKIAQAVEPYPGRWTHHTVLSAPGDVDDTVRAWLSEAYAFAKAKRPLR